MTSARIKIAHLPKENAPCPTGRRLVISGWGRDKMRPFRSREKLWAVSQECLDKSNCPRQNPDPAPPDVIPKNNMHCVGDSENSLNSGCYGDSGGKKFLYTNILVWMLFNAC